VREADLHSMQPLFFESRQVNMFNGSSMPPGISRPAGKLKKRCRLPEQRSRTTGVNYPSFHNANVFS
jgi:hypothetical protein